MSWRVVYTRQARKDARKLAAAGLRLQAERLLELLVERDRLLAEHAQHVIEHREKSK